MGDNRFSERLPNEEIYRLVCGRIKALSTKNGDGHIKREIEGLKREKDRLEQSNPEMKCLEI